MWCVMGEDVMRKRSDEEGEMFEMTQEPKAQETKNKTRQERKGIETGKKREQDRR